MEHEYITPITNVYSTFAEAKESAGKRSVEALFRDETVLDISDLAQGQRNLIVGEPGVGKTLLLQKIKKHLNGRACSTKFINLRRANALNNVPGELPATKSPRALLLDGLDEVKASAFPDVLQRLQSISADYPDLAIYLSSRWVFISRFANSFPQYRFIVISPFTQSQVRKYLLASGHNERDVDEVISRIAPFSQRPLVIQIPRYLDYLDSFLREKGVDAVSQVSRNDLFEYFIYAKLEVEDEKFNEDKRALTKRVLEKLALAMEIYQTNVISKDELMTFFDDIKSDLKIIALTQIPIEAFYDYSLLRVSNDAGLDYIEFENAEFQEYLAAKEIARFSDPSFAAFAFAVDSKVGEIYPTWYNALTFLVEIEPTLLERLVEFSGLRAETFRVVDESFLAFLGRVDLRGVSPELRRLLFKDVMEYQWRTSQWLSGDTAKAIASFFDPSLEPYLMEQEARFANELGDKRLVHLGNIVFVLAYLLKDNVSVDWAYWRDRLLAYACEPYGNGVLQRYALLALQWSKDQTVVTHLPQAMDGDQLVQEALQSALTELAPNEPRSVAQFLSAVSRGDMHGRYGLLAITSIEALRTFLKAFIDDDQFRLEFLDESSIFRDRDHIIAEHIRDVLDGEMREMCKEALVKAAHYDVAHNAERSEFIIGLWKMLKVGDASFIPEMVRHIASLPDGLISLYFVEGLLAKILLKDDVPDYIKVMMELGNSRAAFGVMVRVKLSTRVDAEDVFESGRRLLPNEYKHWEEMRAATPDRDGEKTAKLLEEFRRLLEPEPGKWSTGVFEFFNRNCAEICSGITETDEARLIELLTTVLKSIDPSAHELTFTQQQADARSFTTSSHIFLFKDAIQTAHDIGFDLTPYRQQLIDFIPFAYADDLKIIFSVARDVSAHELDSVLEVYRNKGSDLWRYNPRSFINAVEKYHVLDAVPTLRLLILDSAWDLTAQCEALPIVDSLMPDANFLRKVFDQSSEQSATPGDRANVANELLIVNHADGEALRWRLAEAISRAAPLKDKASGAHAVSDLEREIRFEREFTLPLRKFKYPGYEEQYLDLLDESMGIWAKGEGFDEYAGYLWDVVYSYFDNLKVLRSYAPLQKLEAKIASIGQRQGANWLAARMVNLRRSYISYLGKPENMSSAIAKYNNALGHDPKRIQNSDDLFEQVQVAFDEDLRHWIEGEGAYEILHHRVDGSGRQSYETLVQKTVKTQIENALLRRGYKVEIVREPQLLDDKRPDILVYYGFVGPVVIEIKLTSNTEIQGKKVEKKRSYTNMKRYMEGYGARRGVFMVVDNVGARNLPHVTEAFEGISGVRVIIFNCAGVQAKRQP